MKKKSAVKAKKKKEDLEKLTPISIKISKRELKALKACAKKYATGNLSAWFRYAGLKYVPKKGEVIAHRLSHLPLKK